MSVGSYQRAASSNNSSTSNGGEGPPPAASAAGSGSVRLAGDNTKDRMYEPKHHQKAVRVLTVVAYIFFVSLAAITLSLYYMFIYDPPHQQHQPSDHHLFGASSPAAASAVNTNPCSAPVVIANITDCNQVVIVSVVNRTQSTPIMETPRALPIETRPSLELAIVDRLENKTTSSSDKQENTVRSNLTANAYGFEYGKAGGNDVDYYT